MAWPGTAAEKTQVFKIFGIPQNGSAFVALRIISIYGAAGNTYDFTAVVNSLNSQLDLITATQYTEIQAQLTEWANITDYSELNVVSDSSTTGYPVVDHVKRRRNIRSTLSNLIGFYAPEDGFFTEAALATGGGGAPRIRR